VHPLFVHFLPLDFARTEKVSKRVGRTSCIDSGFCVSSRGQLRDDPFASRRPSGRMAPIEPVRSSIVCFYVRFLGRVFLARRLTDGTSARVTSTPASFSRSWRNCTSSLNWAS